MNDRRDILDYLHTFKNPLDKKFRWEVNYYLKKNAITQREADKLLILSRSATSELVVVVRNGIPLDTKRVGAFYVRQATRINKQKLKKHDIDLFS